MITKQLLIAAGLSFLIASGFAQADSTFTPPSVGSMSQGSAGNPPVCNTVTQKLHWNGSAWQCIPVGQASSAASASSVSGYAKGSIVAANSGTSWSTCPSGSSVLVINQCSGISCAGATVKSICVKN